MQTHFHVTLLHIFSKENTTETDKQKYSARPIIHQDNSNPKQMTPKVCNDSICLPARCVQSENKLGNYCGTLKWLSGGRDRW